MLSLRPAPLREHAREYAREMTRSRHASQAFPSISAGAPMRPHTQKHERLKPMEFNLKEHWWAKAALASNSAATPAVSAEAAPWPVLWPCACQDGALRWQT